ncbi:MAG: MmgE/PrpD family protein, partial [Dehalococcoidia bacterium]|nr:MmgE/PrpD family protein [Dehalococcoidia bacterium]
MPHYLDTLSRFVADATFHSLPPSAIAASRDVTLDTLGAIAAGMLEPENLRLAAWTAENMAPAESTIIVTHHRASAMGAALVNATAGVALEMDEGNR